MLYLDKPELDALIKLYKVNTNINNVFFTLEDYGDCDKNKLYISLSEKLYKECLYTEIVITCRGTEDRAANTYIIIDHLVKNKIKVDNIVISISYISLLRTYDTKKDFLIRFAYFKEI